MLRPVLGFLTVFAVLVMLVDIPLPAQEKGGKPAGKSGDKKAHQEATIVKVNAKGKTIEVDINKKHQHFKLVESVKIVDKNGQSIKLEVFKKGDQVKLVVHEGKVHELHHKSHGSKDGGKKK